MRIAGGIFFLFLQRQRTGKSLPLSVGYTEGFVNKDGKNSQVLQKISFEWPLGKSLRTKVHPPLNCRLLTLVTNYFTDCFSKLFHSNGWYQSRNLSYKQSAVAWGPSRMPDPEIGHSTFVQKNSLYMRG